MKNKNTKFKIIISIIAFLLIISQTCHTISKKTEDVLIRAEVTMWSEENRYILIHGKDYDILNVRVVGKKFEYVCEHRTAERDRGFLMKILKSGLFKSVIKFLRWLVVKIIPQVNADHRIIGLFICIIRRKTRIGADGEIRIVGIQLIVLTTPSLNDARKNTGDKKLYLLFRLTFLFIRKKARKKMK